MKNLIDTHQNQHKPKQPFKRSLEFEIDLQGMG